MSGFRIQPTNGWGGGVGRPCILGIVASMLLCSCVTGPHGAEKKISDRAQVTAFRPSQTTDVDRTAAETPEPTEVAADVAEASVADEGVDRRSIASADSAARADAESVAEGEAASEQEALEASDEEQASSVALKRIDPGAAYLARTIRDRIDASAAHVQAEDGGELIVNIASLRNLSRSTPKEYRAFVDRFAALMNDAGRADRLQFTADPDAAAHFILHGAVYILSADGFDWWELFISVRAAQDGTALWRCEFPVRVMRQPRVGHQQVFIVPLPRVRN
jgi:hypothetical protein